ncbi:MAG: hypothetical protein A3F15_00125 [Candidatus Wildermuthbacteria bacterium RIFCSPHIGHO2_12_FULL_40_12]|uniref:Uncharacterized protein n=1 Tax=Candidatus Wildermuthbacteria bacterium RIFCSPHIGHO2_12_FULL_40_12 TaxID=1802457 RepID=A0A1G2REN0_9BACT|nr:MAG: hypothetical protein A3F15_00125 [Candidatus Wildermuthbacteria bacterium RIFCSPHIGHO2_12_FULL_40_12]
METNLIIYIGIYKALGLIVSLVAGAWYLSHRLTKVETKVDGFDTRLTNLNGRMDNAFSGTSPLSLLPKGQIIIEDSGLRKYIDENKDKLLSQCKQKSSMTNPYDIQESAFKFFDSLEFENEFESTLKSSAFKHGVSLDTIRRIGGIYFRDICLNASGFKLEDLDKPKS